MKWKSWPCWPKCWPLQHCFLLVYIQKHLHRKARRPANWKEAPLAHDRTRFIYRWKSHVHNETWATLHIFGLCPAKPLRICFTLNILSILHFKRINLLVCLKQIEKRETGITGLEKSTENLQLEKSAQYAYICISFICISNMSKEYYLWTGLCYL